MLRLVANCCYFRCHKIDWPQTYTSCWGGSGVTLVNLREYRPLTVALLPSVFLDAPMRGHAIKPDAVALAALQKLDFSPSRLSYNADAQIVGRSNP